MVELPKNPEVPTLVYFNIKGRVEVARLMFEESGKPYQFINVSNQWNEYKQYLVDEGLSPQAQVPLYIDNEVGVLSQTKAINIYIAKKLGFYGKNVIQETRIDELNESINEVYFQLARYYVDAEALKKLKSDESEKKTWKTLISNMENFIFKNYAPQDEGLLGDLSLADFTFMSFMDTLETLVPEFLPEFEKSVEFKKNFFERERIKAYRASDRCPAR